MNELPFELIESGNIGPLPCVQYSARVDEEMAPILGDTPGIDVRNFHVPLTRVIVPLDTRDALLEVTILPETILVGETREVATNLIRAGVSR